MTDEPKPNVAVLCSSTTFRQFLKAGHAPWQTRLWLDVFIVIDKIYRTFLLLWLVRTPGGRRMLRTRAKSRHS